MKLVQYNDLPESEKSKQPNDGYGREEANYLVFEINGEVVYRSDAMEPEDARFTRDLSWIRSDLAALMTERDSLRERVIECHTENKELRAAFDDLFDTHYGMSYHHCGDGDGLSQDDAARIVALVRKIRGE